MYEFCKRCFNRNCSNYIMYNEGMLNKKKMTKQARKMAHKMGINF